MASQKKKKKKKKKLFDYLFSHNQIYNKEHRKSDKTNKKSKRLQLQGEIRINYYPLKNER